jgi:uncharacterized UBP type Zn finger protein
LLPRLFGVRGRSPGSVSSDSDLQGRVYALLRVTEQSRRPGRLSLVLQRRLSPALGAPLCQNGSFTRPQLDADSKGRRCCNAPSVHQPVCTLYSQHTHCQKDSPPPAKITRLMIPAEPEVSEESHSVVWALKCLACPSLSAVPDENQSPVSYANCRGNTITHTSTLSYQKKISAVCKAIQGSLSAAKKAEIKAWEEETVPCSHTRELVQETGTSAFSAIDRGCRDCSLTENLWLCLTCGNIGCGREQFGGVGGHGHGLNHYETAGHSVAVKLGTITPEGTAGNEG